MRDAVYQDLPPGERQLRHERAARVLSGLSATPEQVAAHLLQIPERADQWVVGVLRAAADTALHRGAPDGAAAYLRRALAEPPVPQQRPGVLLQLGQVETLNDGPAAIAHLRAAYDDPITDPATFAAVSRMLIHTLIFTGPEGNAPEFARRASARLDASFTDERQGMQALERIAGYMYSGDPRSFPVDVAEISGDGLGARMLAVCNAWEAFVKGERLTEAARLARFALADGILLRGDPGLFWVIAGRGAGAGRTGRRHALGRRAEARAHPRFAVHRPRHPPVARMAGMAARRPAGGVHVPRRRQRAEPALGRRARDRHLLRRSRSWCAPSSTAASSPRPAPSSTSTAAAPASATASGCSTRPRRSC